MNLGAGLTPTVGAVYGRTKFIRRSSEGKTEDEENKKRESLSPWKEHPLRMDPLAAFERSRLLNRCTPRKLLASRDAIELISMQGSVSHPTLRCHTSSSLFFYLPLQTVILINPLVGRQWALKRGARYNSRLQSFQRLVVPLQPLAHPW